MKSAKVKVYFNLDINTEITSKCPIYTVTCSVNL